MEICIALDLTPPLPSNLGVLKKWAAEPVQNIFLPASTFIANTKGYPVLPKGTQTFIKDSMVVSLYILQTNDSNISIYCSIDQLSFCQASTPAFIIVEEKLLIPNM